MNKHISLFYIVISISFFSCLTPSSDQVDIAQSITFQFDLSNLAENTLLLISDEKHENSQLTKAGNCRFELNDNDIYNVNCDTSELNGFSLYLLKYSSAKDTLVNFTDISKKHYFPFESINENETLIIDFNLLSLNTTEVIQLSHSTDSTSHFSSGNSIHNDEYMDYFMLTSSRSKYLIVDEFDNESYWSSIAHSRFIFKLKNDSLPVSFNPPWTDQRDLQYALHLDLSGYKKNTDPINTGQSDFYTISTYVHDSLISVNSGQQYPLTQHILYYCNVDIDFMGDTTSIELTHSISKNPLDTSLIILETNSDRCTGQYIENDSTSLSFDIPMYTIHNLRE